VEEAENTLFQAVSERLEELGTNAFAVERSAGLPEDAVRSILRRGKKAGTSLNRAQDVCRALGLELYIGKPRQAGRVEVIDRAENYAHIPLHSACLSAGNGTVNTTEEIVGALAFRRDWLRKMSVDPSRAALARAFGDSMEPSIFDGDMLLIDLAQTSPPSLSKGDRGARRSPVFALLDDGEAKVKRIHRADAHLAVLMSDNPDYPPTYARTETLKIIGKVVWWGHANRD